MSSVALFRTYSLYEFDFDDLLNPLPAPKKLPDGVTELSKYELKLTVTNAHSSNALTALIVVLAPSGLILGLLRRSI